MRNLRLILMFIILILGITACGKEEALSDLGESYIEGKDDQPFYGGIPSIKAVNGGYKFLLNNIIYFFDSSQMLTVPVCGKANCTHDTTECDASIFRFVNDPIMGKYEDKIYVIGMDRENNMDRYLYSISQDGSKRTKVIKLFTEDDIENGSSCSLTVHRGYAYFVLKPSLKKMKKTSQIIYKINLEGKAKKEVVLKKEGMGIRFTSLKGYGNNILYSYEGFADEEANGHYWYTSYYNIVTGEIVDNIFAGTDLEKVDTYTISLDHKELYFITEKKIGKMDIESKAIEYLYEIENGVELASDDGTYLYLDNISQLQEMDDYTNRRILVLDKHGNKVDELLIGDNSECKFGDSKFLFLFYENYGDDIVNEVKVFDKTQIGTSRREWKKILSTK